jgi:hypothetical protein
MSTKRPRRDEPDQQHGTSGARGEALCDSLNAAVNASVRETFAQLEEARSRVLAEAHEAAARVEDEAAIKVQDMRREVATSRAAIEAEKANVEKANTFQTSKVLLNVGGHRFETSRQTLTSIPDTYFASLFSGRFELTTDAEGVYFIDRDGTHFRQILNFLRDSGSFELSSGMAEDQRKELAVEITFYGLLDHMMPYYTQEKIGHALVQRACLAGIERDIRAAVAQARALVFDFGSTTPFLVDKYQDLRFVITDRILNGSPVWEAAKEDLFMFRGVEHYMLIGSRENCVEDSVGGDIFHSFVRFDRVYSPTELHADQWMSYKDATLDAQYAAATEYNDSDDSDDGAVCVEDMRVTAVHGLDDGSPTMSAALRQLATLT